MIVMREDEHSFRITRAESVEALVTFLSPTTFRVRILPLEPDTSALPEYVTTKSDESYPPVDVRVDAQPNEVTFNTSAAILNLSLEDQVLSLELRSRDKVLIDGWDIDAGERVARIELQSGERIYGFGDKRAAMDQRGQKIDIVNRDAFASESNQSYKSVPFYMSSAGYGLFFHNYRPSTFDVGASVKNRLQLKASGGEMDFYIFVGAMKEILSQFTELTGRPAMLPLWAFGYHQGKATYRGREGLDVGQQMRAAQAAVRRHLLRRLRPGGHQPDLHRRAVGALPRQADGRIWHADVRDLARQRRLCLCSTTLRRAAS